jgi:hypothetical protein
MAKQSSLKEPRDSAVTNVCAIQHPDLINFIEPKFFARWRLDTGSACGHEKMLPPETQIFFLANASCSRSGRRMILAVAIIDGPIRDECQPLMIVLDRTFDEYCTPILIVFAYCSGMSVLQVGVSDSVVMSLVLTKSWIASGKCSVRSTPSLNTKKFDGLRVD